VQVPCMYVFVDITVDVRHLAATVRTHLPAGANLVLAGTIQFGSSIQVRHLTCSGTWGLLSSALHSRLGASQCGRAPYTLGSSIQVEFGSSLHHQPSRSPMERSMEDLWRTHTHTRVCVGVRMMLAGSTLVRLLHPVSLLASRRTAVQAMSTVFGAPAAAHATCAAAHAAPRQTGRQHILSIAFTNSPLICKMQGAQ